ncbi:glycerol kinase [Roseibium hamelinense]|uniref:Glycerol kinase n=1 Tax=Roseibium hamelinense TaxID=150831 RepID=A0A562SMP9_9HYPH|nr:glycerol kinase GlpK [Roseibium hamelinense]MTI44923.1 glycerol kinase [Roseibium hamelinense]TWI82184.1 glycerol kinase [Roseibium hamelinense]
MAGSILAIDQGTTSSRAILFGEDFQPISVGQREFAQHFPKSGWVEHDPEDLWSTTASVCREAIERAHVSISDVAAIGITNQRETTVVWDRKTGKAVYNAIVWQDRRTSEFCAKMREEGHENVFTAKTGLLLDPYFSGTKIAWILDNVEGVRERAERGELAFGTVDSWLIWNLTGGESHVTDATNASRTLIYNIHENAWDDELCKLLRIPMSMLPEVRDCADDFGMARSDLFGKPLAILGVAGDQQAATLGQACFEPGMVKSTYGTGCFTLINTGTNPVASRNRLLTTVAYRLGGETTYALEGSIFVAGAAVQWLRDGLGLIKSATETQELAEQADRKNSIYLVPAFVGLGAPYWDADARGAIYGLTRATGPADFARAALESVGYQTRDLLDAMQDDWTASGQTVLRVDGGMTASDWTMQFLADILGAPVDRPKVAETTALGAAWLAGSRSGAWPGQAEFSNKWHLDRRFEPSMAASVRDELMAGWRDAVRRTRSEA